MTFFVQSQISLLVHLALIHLDAANAPSLSQGAIHRLPQGGSIALGPECMLFTQIIDLYHQGVVGKENVLQIKRRRKLWKKLPLSGGLERIIRQARKEALALGGSEEVEVAWVTSSTIGSACAMEPSIKKVTSSVNA